MSILSPFIVIFYLFLLTHAQFCLFQIKVLIVLNWQMQLLNCSILTTWSLVKFLTKDAIFVPLRIEALSVLPVLRVAVVYIVLKIAAVVFLVS